MILSPRGLNEAILPNCLPDHEVYQMIAEHIFLDFDPSTFGEPASTHGFERVPGGLQLRAGIAAPLLMVLARLIQGFSVGGEFSGATTMLVEFAPANAIKFTLYRLRPGGSPGDWDMLGCQQYGPLLEVEIPD